MLNKSEMDRSHESKAITGSYPTCDDTSKWIDINLQTLIVSFHSELSFLEKISSKLPYSWCYAFTISWILSDTSQGRQGIIEKAANYSDLLAVNICSTWRENGRVLISWCAAVSKISVVFLDFSPIFNTHYHVGKVKVS